MSDRDALLAAIRAQPDEDTPRLAYADWLDENGQTGRAAFIRAEIAYYQLIGADTAANAVADFLDGQYSEGLDRIKWAATDADLGARMAAHKATGKVRFKLTAKGEGLPRLKGVEIDGYHRGFFDYAWAEDAGAFLKHADAIFAAAPVTQVSFGSLTAEQAQELADRGLLARLREITLGDDVSADAVRVLGSHKDAAAVRKLEFECSSTSAASVRALADGRRWTGLEWLDVVDAEAHDEPPDAEQWADLFARKQFRNLRRLVAWSCQLDDTALQAVAKNMPELRFLDAALNSFSGEGVAALAASKTLRKLRYLDLGSSDVTDGAAVADLITTANLANLTVLRLDGDRICRLNAKVLARPGRGPGLRVLDLDSVRLNAAGAEALAKCPALRGLWFLTLNPDTAAPDALVRFFRHAAFERLTALELSYAQLDADGAKALAEWPGAASLQWLNLGGNNIGEKGAKALAKSPHLTGLKFLHTTGRGVALLKRRFKKVFG